MKKTPRADRASDQDRWPRWQEAELVKPRRIEPSTGGQLAVLIYWVAIGTVILAGFSLWALRHILTPVALAAFMLVMIDGLSRAILRRLPRVPQPAALAAAVTIIVLIFGGSIWLAADNGAAFASHATEYEARLDILLDKAASRFNLGQSLTISDLIHRVNPARYVGQLATGLRSFTESAIFVLIYLGFLLASRRGFRAKWRALFADERRRLEAEAVFDRIRSGVEGYIWVQTVVGVVIALLSAILMLATGLDHVLFWSFVIFVANYIPAIGAAIGVLLPPLFGLLEFGDIVRPLILLVGMEAVHFGVSHVLQPRLQGRRLNLDPIVVLFALAFWSVIWGITGAFLSTPLTVVAMAILAEFAATRGLAVLLSGDGRPYQDLQASED
jgi:AI-2 transport protein TqsA